MLWRRGGGSLESASLDMLRVIGAGRAAAGAGRSAGFSTGAGLLSTGDALRIESGGGVCSLPLSNLAAIEAVFKGRTVCCVDVDTFRVGEGIFLVGEVEGSGVVVVPRVFSHAGGFCEALLVVDWRRVAWDGVVGVSFGLRGELLGVDGRTVDGELSLMEPGLRKGD